MYFVKKREVSTKRRFRMQLVADNGEILIPVEGYQNKQDLDHTIGLIKQVRADTPVYDLTVRGAHLPGHEPAPRRRRRK